MTRTLLACAAALTVSTSAALAGGLQPPIQVFAPAQFNVASVANCPAAQPVVTALQGQGFTRVEVEPGLGQARFSAVRDGTRAIYVYDCRTGAVLQSSGVQVRADEDVTPGVFTMPSAGADFVSADAAMAAGGENDGGVSVGVAANADVAASIDAGASSDISAGNF